jgi:phosphoglycolate phosphatase
MRENSKSLRGLLFDKDGTILDYWKTWVPINREVAHFAAGGDGRLRDELLALGGHDPVTDHVAAGSAFAGGSMESIVDLLAGHLGRRTPKDLPATVARLFRDGGARTSVMLDGARDALMALRRRGFVLGLATNDTAAGLQASLARHDVLDLFAFTVGCDSGHGAKPEPGMVLAFAAAVGVAATEIAVIGDSIHDLEMAARAGVGFKVAVLSGTSGRADLEPHADLVLGSVTDMVGHRLFQRPGVAA